jgi:hypothetical protein
VLKLTVTVVAIALAGPASAAGWRALRIDASSEPAFEESLAEFKEELKLARRYVFGEALKDIWIKGHQDAEAAQREYTAADYYRQLHGLSYEQVVRFTDPSGDTAKDRYRQALRWDPPHRRNNAPPLVAATRPRTWGVVTNHGYPSNGVRGTPNTRPLPNFSSQSGF